MNGGKTQTKQKLGKQPENGTGPGEILTHMTAYFKHFL
jgi:hypothetical protein